MINVRTWPRRARNVPPVNVHGVSRPSDVRNQTTSFCTLDVVVSVRAGVKWIWFPTAYASPAVVVVLDVVAIVPFGYPTRPLGKGNKQRKPLAQVAHRERYGQPLT